MQKTVNDMFTMAQNYSQYPSDDASSSYFYSIFSTPDNAEKPFDKTGLLNYIRFSTGFFQVRDNSYGEFCSHLVAWSHIRLPSWQRVYDALCADYNPLENYDIRDNEHIKQKKHDEYNSSDIYTQEDASTHNLGDTLTNDDTRTDKLDNEHTEGEQTTNTAIKSTTVDDTTTTVAAYDSGDLVNSEKVHDEGTTTNPYDDNKTHSENSQDTSRDETIHDDKTQKDTLEEGSTYNTGSDRDISNIDDSKERSDRHQYKHGNIGVMSSQQLVQQEIDLALQNNIYEIITNDFKDEFCLLVY